MAKTDSHIRRTRDEEEGPNTEAAPLLQECGSASSNNSYGGTGTNRAFRDRDGEATPLPQEEEEAQPEPCNADKMIPETRASALSRLLLSWQTPLLKVGVRRVLEMRDMYRLPPHLEAAHNGGVVQRAWAAEVARVAALPDARRSSAARPSLPRALFAAYGRDWMLAGLCLFVASLMQVSAPLLLRELLNWLTQSDLVRRGGAALPDGSGGLADGALAGPAYGFALVGTMFVAQSIGTVCTSMLFIIGMRVGMQARAGLVATIYGKTLRLSAHARATEFNAGKVTNIISTDTMRVDLVAPFLHFMWSSPLLIVTVLGLLVRQLGVAALAGFALLVVFLPVQSRVMRMLSIYRNDVQAFTDRRVKLMNEVLQGIKVIKMFAWEETFLAGLQDLRNQELWLVRKLAVSRSIINSIGQVIPPFAAVVVFSAYYGIHLELNAATVFSSLALFNLLRLPLMFLPTIIASAVDARVATTRIVDFLCAEELDTMPAHADALIEGKYAIAVENATFEWEPDQPMLSDVSLKIPAGALVAVVGAVGSGKSNLLSGIIGEMRRTQGSVTIAGKTAYCPQQPWIQNATLKDNILFGQPEDPMRYRRAIHLASLEKDLEQLPGGELTEIGEKGINLSGGQKARINLARALYADPDIYLLDDPISAVDAHVGAFLFNSTIACALRGKTRVLVTHALYHVPRCDYVVLFKDGRVLEAGPYSELMASGGEFARQMATYGGAAADAPHETLEHQDALPSEVTSTQGATTHVPGAEAQAEENLTSANGSSASSTLSVCMTLPPCTAQLAQEADKIVGTSGAAVAAPAASPIKSAPQRLMQIEERATGSVDSKVYAAYFRAAGGLVALASILTVLVVLQVFRVGNDLWLTFWSGNTFALSPTTYQIVYVALGLAQAGCYIISGVQFSFHGVIAGRRIHNAAIGRVLRSPMSFFDTTPLGRIINRFSRDIDAMDNLLADSWSAFMITLFTTLATFALMIYAAPLFVVPLVPLMCVYYVVQKFYRHTSRELKRLDSLSRSPLYAHFAETLNGLPTIRAYRDQVRFAAVNRRHQDLNCRPYYQQRIAQRWLAIRLETIGNCLFLAAGVFAVLNDGAVPVALSGLALSYALQITGVLSWCVRQAAETEANMNSVERLAHFSENLVVEAPPVVDAARPPTGWPQRSEIKFCDASMAYRPGLPAVLKNVSLTIPGGSKTAIVGRTGSGKSTLIVALYRLVELCGGKIEIDGLDIAKMGLRDLRSRVSCIPQDPVLFAGTVRSNLDRFATADDAKLWSCLDRAGLKPFVESLEEKLDAPIAENGENLSVGQRQLFCLARAMVRETTLLCLDECTSSVDLETDALIQKAIRRDFAHATVLTIAHRLLTICDYDYVIVMDHGEVAEFGTPTELLDRTGGSAFAAMVDETGPANAALIRQLAKEKRLDTDALAIADDTALV